MTPSRGTVQTPPVSDRWHLENQRVRRESGASSAVSAMMMYVARMGVYAKPVGGVYISCVALDSGTVSSRWVVMI